MRVNQAGFTLLELLVVVAIIGLLVALVIANLLDAADRAKQRSTVADIHYWGVALMGYKGDHNVYPTPAPGPDGVSQVIPLLVPFSISILPATDHWKHDFHYTYDSVNTPEAFTFCSYGKDGLGPWDPVSGPDPGVTIATRFNYDLAIVLVDGIFVNSPE